MDIFNDNVKNNGICIARNDVLQYSQEVMNVSEYNKNLFHQVYRDISEQLGIEVALTIHQMFKGTQVNFPIRFFDTKCVKGMIIGEYNGTNVKMLAKKYDYSEKSIRRIIKESTKRK